MPGSSAAHPQGISGQMNTKASLFGLAVAIASLTTSHARSQSTNRTTKCITDTVRGEPERFYAVEEFP
jgi:hypothetical protein